MKFKRKLATKPTQSLSSMADIAFLLLIYFMVTSTIKQDFIIPRVLPALDQNEVNVLDARNLMSVHVNQEGELLLDSVMITKEILQEKCLAFITNKNTDISSSESPQKATIIYTTDELTAYEDYLTHLDEMLEVYYGLRAKQQGISIKSYLAMAQKSDTSSMMKITQSEKLFPIRISEKIDTVIMHYEAEEEK